MKYFVTDGVGFDLNLRGKNISGLGLTYKDRTNTLRRSAYVELCKNSLYLEQILNVMTTSLKRTSIRI